MRENWTHIYGYNELYWVSSLGRVKSKSKILKPTKGKNGYLFVRLSKRGKYTYKSIHRLVVENFFGVKKSTDVNHKDSDRTNNKLINLEFCTRRYNLTHARIMNRMNWIDKHKASALKGERQPSAKLTNDKVLKIFNSSEMNGKLAARFGICRQQVYRIKNKLAWTHVTEGAKKC